MELNTLLTLVVKIINSNFYSGCAGALLTIIFSWLIIPYFKKRNDIESFIQYFYFKQKINNIKMDKKKNKYDIISDLYILNSDNYPILIEECYKNGLMPSNVIHYINDRTNVPLRISKDGIVRKFPYNNDILYILFKARKQIIWSIIIIGMIIICKFII